MGTQHSEFAEFHDELRTVAGELLAKEHSLSWPVLVEAGWAGLEIPDRLGGAGVTFAEVAVVAEEVGKAAGGSALLGSALATGALKMLSPSDSRDELLAGIASGKLRVAVVLDGFRLEHGLLEGHADFVPDAHGADRLLVVATGADDVPVLIDTTGLQVTPQPVLDETRSLATVRAERVAVAESPADDLPPVAVLEVQVAVVRLHDGAVRQRVRVDAHEWSFACRWQVGRAWASTNGAGWSQPDVVHESSSGRLSSS